MNKEKNNNLYDQPKKDKVQVYGHNSETDFLWII